MMLFEPLTPTVATAGLKHDPQWYIHTVQFRSADQILLLLSHNSSQRKAEDEP